MARKGAGKVRHVEARPQNEGRPTLPPDPKGNRQQRRTATLLARQGRTVEQKPSSADELIDRIEAMPDWKTVNVRELGRRLGLHPNKARGIRKVLLQELAKQSQETEHTYDRAAMPDWVQDTS